MYIFDDNEKAEAHNISTTDYLSRNYGLTFKSDGRGYRCVEHNSLYVNKDDMSWYWNSHSVGGGDVIAFVQKFDDRLNSRLCNLGYAEALKIVLNPILSENKAINTPSTSATYKKASKKVEENNKSLILPEAKDSKYNRLFAYLIQTRKIDKNIVSCLIHKKYLYEDKRGNIIFVGRDSNKKAKYATIRGTLTDKQFRMDCIGSDKSNGFYLNGFDKNTIYVFEAPIDLLSHASLDNISNDDCRAWLSKCRISLGGVSDIALVNYLNYNKAIDNIVFCLDNDKAGIEATKKYIDKFSKLGYICSSSPAPQGKDYNEYLQMVVAGDTKKHLSI